MAAPTLALVSATPNYTKYLFTDDGTGGGALITLAQLILDAQTAAPGPSLLAADLAAKTDVTWPDTGKSKTSFYATVRANVASGFGVSVLPQNTAPGVNSLLVTAKTGTALTAIIEIICHNTLAA